jgi:hypothetical protein
VVQFEFWYKLVQIFAAPNKRSPKRSLWFRRRKTMKYRVLIESTFIVTIILYGSAAAQCDASELVRGASKYNEFVCKASTAVLSGDDKKALDLYLSALKEPVLESPNIRLFAVIARTYAKLGEFQDADLYMKYDNLAALWMIGIVRCQETSNPNESLFQDGKMLVSEEAIHMADVLCGPMFDEFSYFRDRDTASFVPAANTILRHERVRNEIDAMRRKHGLAPRRY